MLYFNFNGKIIPENTPVTGPDSRGLKYGDGLFETMKYSNGKLILADEHFARLWKGMQLLKFQPAKLLTPELLQKETQELIKKNKLEYARVRIAVIRDKGGLFDTSNYSTAYIIQSWPLPGNYALLNENGLQLCFYRDAKKSIDLFSNLKHNNYLPYFMGALFAKEQYCNDAIILNNFNRVADTAIANIFLVKNNNIMTPGLDEGCVAGVMRKFIITELRKAGYSVIESKVAEDEIMDADEIFLTNSIYNLRWVAMVGDRKYSNDIIKKIYGLLRQTNGAAFC